MNLNINKIIVHPGRYQADEILGVAEIKIIFPALKNLPVIRTRPTEEDLSNPKTLVIDCGERYQPGLNNFDHHQDKELYCSSRLLWEHFFPEDTELQMHLKRAMDATFFRSVDRHDRGRVFGGGNSISSAISSMNEAGVDFDKAYEFAYLALNSLIERQKKVLPVRMFWLSGKTFGGSRRLRVFSQYCKNAIQSDLIKYAGDTKKALYLLWPVSDDGKYILRTVFEDQVIPQNKKQLALDTVSAVYKNKGDALEHALELAALKFEKDRKKERLYGKKAVA
ncbi:MYG1 family protein [Candidatus Nomurabacteria bacterium]|nr:MYG1 family protein [Candidatus Nomurabacteria bacterium]